MRGRRNPDRPQSNILLPPCRVCGEKGSGFHYGVTTCGACKGFFRRSLVRNEPYVCMKSHLCKVGPSTSRRQSCPKCRYDKCISVGMSKDACKVGRYSLVKKSKDIAEMLKYQMDRPGDEGFIVDQAVFEKSASLSKLTSDSRDNDLNSTGTISSAPCSPDYSELPTLHSRNFDGKDYIDKPEIPRSASCFMQESERMRESYCDVTHYNSEDNVYSDIEAEDVYSSYHMNGQNSFGNGGIYSKTETYPPAYQTGVTSSSFLEASPVMMDSFTQELEAPAFDPLFARSQESNYTVLQAANLPQYTSTPNSSLISEPLMPSSISSSVSGSNLDSPSHESSGLMLTTHRPTFEQPNISSNFCASPLVTSPNSSCDFRLNSASTLQNHHCRETAMSENRNQCNPEFVCQVSTPFGSSSTPLSSHSMSYNHHATHSAPTTPRHHLSDGPVISSTPTPVFSQRDYSIDELIAQSIHTEAWSDQNWTSGSLDQRSRQPGSAMAHASVHKPESHVDTTQSSWVNFKSSTPVSEINRGSVIAPQSTKLSPEDYTTSSAADCVDSFLSTKPDHFLEVKSTGIEKTDLKLDSIVETRSEGETEDEENVSKSPCLQIVKKDNKRKYDEMCDDDTSVISPTTSTPSSFFLLFICPELAPYGLAMYDQFPFASYEQQCLKPFLNSCVDTGDALKSSLAGDANIGCLEIMPDSEITHCLSVETDMAPTSKADEPISNLGSLLDGEGKIQMNFCDQDLDLTLSSLMEAHDRTVGLETNSMTDMEIKTAQDIYRGLCKLRDRLHGPMQFIDKDVYSKVFVSTGVDVDKRREYIGLYASIFNHNLPKAIRFFRSVPGFQALSMADRIVLAKAALHEYCLLSSYKGADQQNEIVINLEYMIAMRMSVLEKAFPEVALTRRQANRLNVRLKALDLTKEELVLLKAICLTQPQRKQLQDPMLAERLHQKLLSCLLNYLRKNHLKPEERYADLFNVLRDINFVGSMSQQVIKDNQDYYLLLLNKLPVKLCTEAIFGARSSDLKAMESKLEENKIQELT